MRRKNQEIIDRKIIEEILSKSLICRIGMICDGVPYIVPLNYGYNASAIYIHSASEGKKIDILKTNKKVCFEIEDSTKIIKKDLSCDWATKYRSLIGYGSVEIITDFEQKKRGLDIIMAQHGKKENNVYKENQVEKMVILKLIIKSVTGKQSGNWN
ncbi:MAG: pyridoxamine 5'-phosphate oxidase family protein [Bacteroidota bacterium]|jgi:nitroimidazol reductase NimA-like FMN-containing flavoprotein (pyridoxamine 5'-phosphate oxidase superfamily)